MLASIVDGASVCLILAGLFFFLAGTVGLLRFPDVFTRLHALTKADNLGLGLIVIGLWTQSDAATAARLAGIWLLVLASSAIVCHSVARAALRLRIKPWEKR